MASAFFVVSKAKRIGLNENFGYIKKICTFANPNVKP